MSLSLLAVLAVPLFLGPWTTHRVYEQVESRLKSAIAVDNASILLGRAGRETLEAWRKMESALKIAEVVHHVAHLCARTPGPNLAVCVAQDQAWEEFWESRLLLLEATTLAAWRGAEVVARGEGARLGVPVSLTGYSDTPPVFRRPCPLCGGRFQISWREPPRPRWDSRLESSGTTWRKGVSGQWQYRLQLTGEGNESDDEPRDGAL